MSTRREFLRLMTGAGLAATELTAGCARTPVVPTRQPTPRPTETRPAAAATPTETLWSARSAAARMQALEYKKYPTIEGFDADKELAQATTELYCQATNCRFAPGRMAKSISYVDSEIMLQKGQEVHGREFTKEEAKRFKREEVALTTSQGEIYINKPILEDKLKKIPQVHPEIIQRLAGKDLETIIKRSLLIHEFTHMNLPYREMDIEGFSLRVPGANGPVNFETMTGFRLEGKDLDKAYYIQGADEAVVEYGAMAVAKKSKLIYISIAVDYAKGAAFISDLNKASDISDNEFLNYINGDLYPYQLLQRWGSLRRNENMTQLKAGTLALASIGLHAQGVGDTEDTQRYLNQILILPSQSWKSS